MSKKPFVPPATDRGDSRVFDQDGKLISVNGSPVDGIKKTEAKTIPAKDKVGGKD